jgi:hypothetical protein
MHCVHIGSLPSHLIFLRLKTDYTSGSHDGEETHLQLSQALQTLRRWTWKVLVSGRGCSLMLTRFFFWGVGEVGSAVMVVKGKGDDIGVA